MKSQKEKGLDRILLGLVLNVLSVIAFAFIQAQFRGLFLQFSSIFNVLFLFSFLFGYLIFISGCSLYAKSKGYSPLWGFWGLLSIFGLSILLFLNSRDKRIAKGLSSRKYFDRMNIIEFILFYISIIFLLNQTFQSMILGTSRSKLLSIICWCLIFSVRFEKIALNHQASILPKNNLNKALIYNPDPIVFFTLSLCFFYIVSLPIYGSVIFNATFLAVWITAICILMLWFTSRQFKYSGLSLKTIIGSRKISKINLKLVLPIVIALFVFNWGFNHLYLYYLSFLIPSDIENFLNDPSYVKISGLIPLSIAALIVAPVYEEFLFRGIILQKWSLKWGVRWGIISSSFLFAIGHFRLDIISLFFTGIILSTLYFKSNSLITPIACHFLFNLLSIGWIVFSYFQNTDRVWSATDYQNMMEPYLGQMFFLVAISLPFLLYFIYKNFPRQDAILPYDANREDSENR